MRLAFFARVPNSKHSFHCVAFLDLMGQRQAFTSIKGIPRDGDTKELTEVLKKTIGHIAEFRKWFRNLFEGFQGSGEVPAHVPAEFHDEFRKMRKVDVHLQNVSDAVIAWSRIHTVDEGALPVAMNGIWGILSATAAIILLSLAAEHPVRGGIEVDGGITIFPRGDEIYGPALNCAYYLEQEVAKYPRVVIGPGLVKFLRDMSQITGPAGTERLIGYAKLSAQRCQGLISMDTDGQPFVHFLGPNARELHQSMEDGDHAATREIINRASHFVDVCVEQFKENEKLGSRYLQLQQYFRRFSPEWLT